MRRIVFILALLFFFFSCGKNRISGDNYEGIIVKGDFVPSEKEIAEFESGFKPYLESQDSFYFMVIEERQLIISNLGKYKRRYSGKMENGKRLLIVEAMLPECIGDKWTNENYHIADGGDCVIHIVYNLSTHQYSDFSDNGSG
jgi:hypothetical protein